MVATGSQQRRRGERPARTASPPAAKDDQGRIEQCGVVYGWKRTERQGRKEMYRTREEALQGDLMGRDGERID
jgi:hypothetical protein